MYQALWRHAHYTLGLDLVFFDCTERNLARFKTLGARGYAPNFDNGTGIGSAYPLYVPVRDFEWILAHRPMSALRRVLKQALAAGEPNDSGPRRAMEQLFFANRTDELDAAGNSTVAATLDTWRDRLPFSLLTSEQQGALFPVEEVAEAGAVVIEAGDRSRDMFYVVDINTPVLLSTPHGLHAVNKLAPGEVVGELGWALHHERSASVVPLHRTRLLRFPAGSLDGMLAEFPRDAWRLYEGIAMLVASRIRLANQTASLDASEASVERDDRFDRGANLAWRYGRLFEGVSDGFLADVRRARTEYPPGTPVVTAGAAAGASGRVELFLVEAGSVEVERAPGEPLATLGVGAFFGELSFLDGGPRSATVTAVEPTTLVRIQKRAIREAGRDHPVSAARFFKNMLGVLDERLRHMNPMIDIPLES
jgi:CRP-like cAMP-binding protein